MQKLTGGTLVSRNKDYIVFYRGNDFLPPAVTEALTERRKLNLLKQDEEDQVRQMASSLNKFNGKASQIPLVAGTLAETKAATTQWGHEPSSEEVENMRRDSTISKLTSIVKNLEKKLAHVSYTGSKSNKWHRILRILTIYCMYLIFFFILSLKRGSRRLRGI